MKKNHKICPICNLEMHRQSKRCLQCWKMIMQGEDFRHRISEAHKGKPSYQRTEEHRRKTSLFWKGTKRLYPTGGSLPGVAEKIRRAWTPEMKEAAWKRGIQNALDREWRLSCGRSGELNGNYLHGQSLILYSSGWTPTIKKSILERDNYICQDCGSKNNLHVHHCDFLKNNHFSDNLLTLCHACHFARHAKYSQKSKSPINSPTSSHHLSAPSYTRP